ncbi:hypothetical protein IAU59_000256 [Kwoniella sp. CBS 9459]
MVRSGLQHDVIKMYRQGVKNAMTKSPEARPNFMLHLRYHFRNPPLRQRDYTAIEHQLRRMSRTLEMLSEPSTQRMAVSDEWKAWWADEVQKTKARVALRSSQTPESNSSPANEGSSSAPPLDSSADGVRESQTASDVGGKKLKDDEVRDQVLKRDERDRDQWGGKLPGHGGT